MKHPRVLAGLIAALFVTVIWVNSRALPQQMPSGAQPVSVASLPLPAGASTEATLALIKAKTDNLDVLLSTRTKPADTQLVSGSFSAPSGCGNANYDSGVITLPNASTAATATATCVQSIILINLTASQQTCTVTDGQGTPANLIPPSFDILAKSSYRFPLDGVKAIGGIKWSCTNAASVVGIVRGVQ